jgi:hypothetical protein
MQQCLMGYPVVRIAPDLGRVWVRRVAANAERPTWAVPGQAAG